MSTLVIIPTYNERDNLPVLVPAVLDHPECRVLVVDDSSPDGTGDVAEALARQYPGRVEVIHRTGRRGLGLSYIDGFARALAGDADTICQMDADLSHDPKYLGDLIDASRTHDLVIGSRYLQGVSVVNWPLRRIVLSQFANFYIRTVTRVQVRDCTSGYRCWRRETLRSIPRERIKSDGYSFLVEMLYEAARRSARITEVPIIFVERRQGQSKLSTHVLVESLLTPWRIAWRSLWD